MQETPHTDMGGLQLVFGLVDEVKYSPLLRIRATLPDMDDILSPWAQVLTPRSQTGKTFDPPVVGEQVALLLMDDAEFALCLGSVFSEEDTSPADKHQYTKLFDDGTRIDYDPENSALTVSAVGTVTVICEGDAILKAPNITLDGEVAITKGLTVADDAVIGGKSFLRHRHGGVRSGGANTAPPV